MEVKKIKCNGCKSQCEVTAEIDGEKIFVYGNNCMKGEIYAKKCIADEKNK